MRHILSKIYSHPLIRLHKPSWSQRLTAVTTANNYSTTTGVFHSTHWFMGLPYWEKETYFPNHWHRLARPSALLVPKAINHLKMEMVESFPLKNGKAYKNKESGNETRECRIIFHCVSVVSQPGSHHSTAMVAWNCLSALIENGWTRGELGSQYLMAPRQPYF